jgi:Flp pilus assembly pilin Flp
MEHSQQTVKKSLRNDTSGLSTVEYIILLVLIAAAGVGLWNTFGGMLTEKLGKASTDISSGLGG